jgi:predicted tellurium resistance membrane protein TerC
MNGIAMLTLAEYDWSSLAQPEALIALLTLTSLEIVLGIDNVIFIAILCGRLPEHQRDRARIIGLSLAMLMRIALLFAISWVMGLKDLKLFTLPIIDHIVSGKDLVMLLGGLFLVAKSTYEIHHKIETGGVVEPLPHAGTGQAAAITKAAGNGFAMALVQILLVDLVFSLDSVITAVGMTDNKPVMVIAIVAAVGVMLVFSGYIARFVDKHPTIKMLALSFLILIGVMLIVEGTGGHIDKKMVYFAMAFSLGVEMLNIWAKARAARKALKAAQ